MALAARMMGGGISAGMAQAINGDLNNAVSAAGTTQGTATALKSGLNNVTTVASSAGVILPAAQPGDCVKVYNGGANTLTIYPPTGAKINQAATNAGISLGVNTYMYLDCFSSTQWKAILSA